MTKLFFGVLTMIAAIHASAGTSAATVFDSNSGLTLIYNLANGSEKQYADLAICDRDYSQCLELNENKSVRSSYTVTEYKAINSACEIRMEDDESTRSVNITILGGEGDCSLRLGAEVKSVSGTYMMRGL